jgi:hypothetical protein
MATYTQRLALVQAAIDGVLAGGQNVSFGGRAVTMANLASLEALESNYLSRAAMEKRAANGGGRAGITYVIPL